MKPIIPLLALALLAGCATGTTATTAAVGTYKAGKAAECARPIESRKAALAKVRKYVPGKQALDCDGDGQPDFEMDEGA